MHSQCMMLKWVVLAAHTQEYELELYMNCLIIRWGRGFKANLKTRSQPSGEQGRPGTPETLACVGHGERLSSGGQG